MKTRLRNSTPAAVSALLVLAGCLGAATSSATPLLATDGTILIENNPSIAGLTAVPESATVGSSIGSIDLGAGEQILLSDYDSQALVAKDPSWWNIPGLVYTTTTNGMFIDFVGLDVTAFTFNIGANQNARAWIRASYEVDGVTSSLQTNWFSGIGPQSTPGYGVSFASGVGGCARITQIEVDPTFEWGIGNFALGQSNTCASVPEPGATGLLGLGLLSIGFAHLLAVHRRRQTA